MSITPIPTVDPSSYNQLINNISLMDPVGILGASTLSYTNVVGNVFYLFIWVMILSMYWLAQRSITIPSTMGFILGGAIIATLPESYQPVAVALIALSGFTVIYYLYTERR